MLKKGISTGLLFCFLFQSYCILAQESSSFYSPSNSINNSFLTDNIGKLYLIYNEALFYNLNVEGDGWDRIKAGIKSFAIDPVNNDIHYLITTNDNVLKKVGASSKYISIMNGLPRIEFNTIVINPHNTNEIFLGTKKGIYRTMDAGFYWEYIGLDKEIKNLIISSSDKMFLVVLTESGLYSSADAGINWSRCDLNLPKKVIKGTGRTATELPISVNLITYCNNINGILVVSPDGLFISSDKGESWTKSTIGLDEDFYKYGAKCFYSNDSIYYLGSMKSIYKSDNSGKSWSKISLSDSSFANGAIIGISDKWENGLMLNDNIGNIFFYRNDGKIICINSGITPHSVVNIIKSKMINNKQRLYVLAKNNHYVDIDNFGIFYSDDEGLSWRKSLTYKWSRYVQPRLYFSPLNDEIWHFINNESAHYYSENNGDSWIKRDEFYFKYLNDRISDFEFDPIQSNVKYICAGVNDFSLFKYDQKTQNKMSLNVEASSMMVASDDIKKLFTSSMKLSTDGGWNWESLMDNINKTVKGSYYLPIYFSSNEIMVYVSNWDNYHKRGQHYLIVSNNSGKDWRILKTIENNTVFVVSRGKNDSNSIAMVLDNKKYGIKVNTIEVILSQDRGVTWKSIYKYNVSSDEDSRDNKKIIQSILVVKNEVGSTIFLGGSKGLLKSIDGGNSWEKMGGIK